MSTFTGRELEFLAGLNKSWWLLYWRELARVCVLAGISRVRSGRLPFSRRATEAQPAAVEHGRVELAGGNR
jgi:hypothetical protein